MGGVMLPQDASRMLPLQAVNNKIIIKKKKIILAAIMRRMLDKCCRCRH